jgi:hypothetical protein
MDTFFQTSFEEGFYDYQDIKELTCPKGWKPGWIQGTKPGVLHRPEYDAKDTERRHPEVRTGRFAANFFTVHATHDACLYHKFKVGEDVGVRASVWCMNVTHEDDLVTDGGHGMRIGIDPTGGTDHNSLNVLYGPWWSSYMKDQGWEERKWRRISVDAISEAKEITVFLHARADWAVDINASHWDDFELEVGDKDEVSPPEREELEIGKFSLGQLTQMIREIVQEELAKSGS